MSLIVYARPLEGELLPADEFSQSSIELLKPGIYQCQLARPRNIQFHRKFFALLRLGFAMYNAPNLWVNGMRVQKNFDKFREDVTILAGYYIYVFDIKGKASIMAKSISFANMDDVEFQALYSSLINVLLENVCVRCSKEDLNNAVENILRFDY